MSAKTLFTFSMSLIIANSMLLYTNGALAAPVPIETSALDNSLRTDTDFRLGATLSIAQRPFVGVDDQITSLPYIVYQYKDFYIEGINLGYHLLNRKDFSINLLATPRFYEVQPSFADNGELDGIDKTRPTYFAGVSTQYRLEFATLTLQLLTDLRESNGNEFVLTASKAFKLENTFTLAPSIGITYQDAELVDHFYGVQAHETRVNRPEYGGRSSTNVNASLTVIWDASKNIQWLGQAKYEILGSGITNSPIIDEDSIISAVMGIVYRF